MEIDLPTILSYSWHAISAVVVCSLYFSGCCLDLESRISSFSFLGHWTSLVLNHDTPAIFLLLYPQGQINLHFSFTPSVSRMFPITLKLLSKSMCRARADKDHLKGVWVWVSSTKRTWVKLSGGWYQRICTAGRIIFFCIWSKGVYGSAK